MHLWQTFRAIAIATSVLLSACTLTPTTNKGDDPLLQQCQQQLSSLQRAVKTWDAGDAQLHPVKGFPTYRTNRFWSSFSNTELEPEQEIYWRQKLHRQGMSSLQLEWQNLPATAKTQWGAFTDFAQRCDQPLFEASQAQALNETILQVPDSYSTAQRFFGIYGLIKYGAAGSIAEYQEEMRHRMTETSALPAPVNHYVLAETSAAIDESTADGDAIGEWLDSAMASNPLGIPELNATQLETLLKIHSPQVSVAQQTEADLIGSATWQQHGNALQRTLNTDSPVLYTDYHYIRFQQQTLLQLSYTLWFSERPKPSRYDWYGGKLDGLVWRVTLDRDGSVLFYDSIHPCGCYHSVHLPEGSRLQSIVSAPASPQAEEALEPIMFFDANFSKQQQLTHLLVESATHYLVQVAATNTEPKTTAGAIQYQLQPYDQLRSIATSEGYRSWFDNDGLIASSARFERFFLWPLGVPSAGAMRQQGNHAIAFVGRRHFDEARVETLLNLPKLSD